jgi:hypothetical protein
MPSTVIHAAVRFRCLHLYASIYPAADFMFVCVHCGHRTECLDLEARKRSARVIAFPITRERAVASSQGRVRRLDQRALLEACE